MATGATGVNRPLPITIRAEIAQGALIFNACQDIVALADRINCRVEAKFSGVTLIANPGDAPARIVNDYERKLDIAVATVGMGLAWGGLK